MDAKLQSLYQETLLKHSRSPLNQGHMPDPTVSQEIKNPLCGDIVTVHLRIRQEEIAEAKFEGQCCSICMASASMLTERAAGNSIEESKAFALSLIDMLSNPDADPTLSDDDELNALFGVKAFPSRIRCATLPWEGLQQAIAQTS